MFVKKLLRSLLLAGLCTSALGASDEELADVQALINAGQFELAIDDLESIMDEYPGDVDAWFLMAVVLAQQGQTDAAIAIFRDLTIDHPDFYESYNNLAVLYAAKGDFEAAREALLEAIKMHPRYGTIHENLGDLYGMMAAAAYERALVLDQNNQSAMTKLTMVNALFSTKSSQLGEVAPEAEPGFEIAEPANRAAQQDQQVLAAVLAWAAAWSAQNVDAYLGYYAEDFRPADSMPRSVWESQRRDRIESPEHIEVSIQDAVVQAESDERVQVSFVQQYRSDNYSDQTNKEITLLRVDGSWKIVSETALP